MKTPLKKSYEEYISSLLLESDTIKTGLHDLDLFINGFEKGCLYTIAGRPSMGKTSLALSITANILRESEKAVAYFSYEMTGDQIMTRLVSAESELDPQKLRTKDIKDYEYQQLVHKSSDLENWLLTIRSVFNFDIDNLESEIRKYKNDNQADIVIIDDIQRIKIDIINRKYAANREQEVSNNVRRLKDLAKELNIPIIIISQLNRQVEIRGGEKKPQLIDLRDSGAIENDSDMVFFLYRAEYYGITEDEYGVSTGNKGELIIAKNRMGSVGSVQLKYVDRFCRFSDLEGSLDISHKSDFDDAFDNSFENSYNSSAQSIKLPSKRNIKENDADSDEAPF